MRKVLVVENHLPTADRMCRLLRQAGHEFMPATSLRSALEMAEMVSTADLGEFDVLLTGLELPETEECPEITNPAAGFELAKNICGMFPGIKVVFCTTKDASVLQDGIPDGLGRVSLLQKPFRYHDLQLALAPRKKAAIVALFGHPKEEGAIRELERDGYTVHVPLEDPADTFAVLALRRELLTFYDEIVTVEYRDLIR